jgi:MarR family 2-MHQ and catechol resistance regulon transcriptional repressor
MATHFRGKPSEVRALNTLIALLRAAESVSARLNSRLEGEDITPAQFGALEALFHLGPLTHQRLAEKMLRSCGNITLIVDNLEKRGLARRVRDENDRRARPIELTADGKALMRRIFPAHATAVAREFSVLTAAEQEQLRGLCKKLGIRTN